MSRIGRLPVVFDKAVTVTVTPDNEVIVKGAKSTEKVKMNPAIKATIDGNKIVLTRKDDAATNRALHGLYRSLVQNAVIGVTSGFQKTLLLNGVGYRAAVKGKALELTLGYSHAINFEIPQGITITVEKNTTVVVSGSNKEQVGHAAAKIRGFREPEPYLGKGVKYSDETIRRKAGKAAGK